MKSMSTTDLDVYLIENWLDMEAAATRAAAIDDTLHNAVADAVRGWADARGWVGVFSNDLWLAPPEWAKHGGARPDADAYFALHAVDDDNDNYWLTAFATLDRSQAGFIFGQTRIKQRAWKQTVSSPELLSALPGFALHDGQLYHPLKLDRDDVLEAARSSDYRLAVSGVVGVLDRLEAAVEVFERHLGPRGDEAA